MAEVDEVTLSVNGQEFAWWQNVQITTNLQNYCRTFTVGLTRDLSSEYVQSIPLKLGDEVEVSIGEDLVLSGYITNVQQSYSATGVSLTVSGASYTVDLCDCTLPLSAKHSFKKQTVAQIIESLATHYSVNVVDLLQSEEKIDLDVSPFDEIKRTLDGLIKEQSILLTDDAEGNIVITTAGRGGDCFDSLVTGVNILTGSRNASQREIFSEYVVLAQAKNSASEQPVTSNQLSASASNYDMRQRVRVVQQDGTPNRAQITKRAQLLRDYSSGKSESLTYTVQGWRQSNGSLWTPNSMVHVVDPILEVFGDYVISSVTYGKSESGTTTSIQCVPLSTYLNTELKDSSSAVKKSANEKNYSFVKKGNTEGAKWTTQ